MHVYQQYLVRLIKVALFSSQQCSNWESITMVPILEYRYTVGLLQRTFKHL
jgi:hypothetical protein